MRYLDAALAREFDEQLHPEVCVVVVELDEWSEENGIPQVVVTCIVRTPARNAAVNGAPKSWHLVAAAIDLRSKHYTPTQKAAVLAWLKRRCPTADWECFEHNAGTGWHIHLARKDLSWRNTFEKRPALS